MIRVFFFFVGFFFLVRGFTYFILYLNLFTFGYSVFEYFEFIFRMCPTILFFVGLILVGITCFRRERDGER